MPATVAPAPPRDGSSLEFAGLFRHFGALPVLAGVSGRVGAGEVLAVGGPNGSGKSTLLRCLAALLRPQAGTIAWREGGEELSPEERRRRAGYLGPDLALYEGLTGEENLRLFARLRRLPDPPVGSLLARVGLPPGRRWGAMSSGMRQRLRWAWTLLHRPHVLLLDEPFQNLDAAGEAVARELLAEHLEGGGLAVVASPTPIALPAVATRLELGAPS